jgi:hypothetical protein
MRRRVQIAARNLKELGLEAGHIWALHSNSVNALCELGGKNCFNRHNALGLLRWGTQEQPRVHDYLMTVDAHTASWARHGLDRGAFKATYAGINATRAGRMVMAAEDAKYQVPGVCNTKAFVAIANVEGNHWVRCQHALHLANPGSGFPE